MGDRIHVVVADDHDLFREGLIALIARDSDIDVVGQAKDGSRAIEMVAQYRPNVLLLDVEMPGVAAPATISHVHRTFPTTQVLVLTMHRDVVLQKAMLSAGAARFLTKMTPAADLITVIHELASPGRIASASVDVIATRSSGTVRPLLTDRELRVLQLMAAAYSNEVIGAHLSIATGTVKRHASNIFNKLGATSRMDAVRRGARLGLIDA